jgi:nitrite reductase/ring-hydroxylating ferredoxin subunit
MTQTADARPTYPVHPDAQVPAARGDAISGDRYWSRDFAEREWEHMWKKVWHVGGRVSQLEEPGDFIVHDFKHESVIMVMQEDRSIRAFFNVCMHRGNRLVTVAEGGVNGAFTCPYHGWKWNINGGLDAVQDPEDFPQGNPCGKLKLKELRCETWGGFIFWSFDPQAKPLLEYLDPIPTLFANRDLESYTRVVWRTLRVNTNWKFASDNFNEAYHVPVVHPQFQPMIDDHYSTTIFEMYPNGHNRMIEKLQPSSRYPDAQQMKPLWAEVLKEWDLNPADFDGRAPAGPAQAWAGTRLCLFRQAHRCRTDRPDAPHVLPQPDTDADRRRPPRVPHRARRRRSQLVDLRLLVSCARCEGRHAGCDALRHAPL